MHVYRIDVMFVIVEFFFMIWWFCKPDTELKDNIPRHTLIKKDSSACWVLQFYACSQYNLTNWFMFIIISSMSYTAYSFE